MRKSVAIILLAAAAFSAGAKPRHDGDLDAAYGTFGYNLLAFPGDKYLASGVQAVLQADGKLLLSASKFSPGVNGDFGVLRLGADGSVDTSFGIGGAATIAFDRAGSSYYDSASGLALQADGKIVVAGTVPGDDSTGNDFGIARITGAGQPDNTFGVGGKSIVPFNLAACNPTLKCGDDLAIHADLQGDGKILVVGEAKTSLSTSLMALARLTTYGFPDSSFDGDGKVTIGFNGDIAVGLRARQLADGQHILVVGGANAVAGSDNRDFAIARLDSSGQLDPNFGIGGKTTYAFDIGGDNLDSASDFVELADGKLLVCGYARVAAPYNSDMACMRFTADGKPDDTFTPVLIAFDVGGNLFDAAFELHLDSQQRIVVAGFAERDVSNADFAAVRLLSNGALDTSFGTGGYVRAGSNVLFGTDRNNAASAVAIQADEKILVAGSALSDDAGDVVFEVVRLMGDTILAADFDGS
jgi:uncharacterized delta-60 repeat protein